MKLPRFYRSLTRSFSLGICSVLYLSAGIPEVAAQNASTIVYEDALWQRVHAADCPTLILKELKQTMTLGEADQLGYRIGESGQSGRTNCCLTGYTRQFPAAVTANDAMGVAEIRPGDVLKYHVHGCHRFTPAREDLRMTLGAVMATPGNYHCEHCIERGTGVAQMTQEEWDNLPSDAPWVAPLDWVPSSFAADSYPDQEEIDILVSQSMHGGAGIQERIFINPVASVDNFMIMRFFFPVHRWLELYQTYRVTGDTDILEQLRVSARNYNTLSKNYLSAAQMKAQDPEGMAYMYTMAASAKITLQLARKYPSQVTAGELAEAEDFLMTIISVLQPTCEGNSNLDSQMGIPQSLADDFRNRAFNRALNGIGTIGMTVAALEDLQFLNSTTAYQSQIDRYRKIIEEYIINWKNTGWQETVAGKDYFTYPYAATDSGSWSGGVKLFSVDDQGHFSHSMQGCYLLFESVPELGVDDAFMTAIANTVEFNSTNVNESGSPQTPSQEAVRPGYSRKPFGLPTDRFYLLNAFNSGVIDGQCSKLSALSKESTNSQYGYRLATFNAFYLKELREDPTLIHMGEDSVAPPAAPTGLAGTGSNGSVSLNWDDNTETDMGSGTYTVYRSTTSGSGYSQIATNLSASAYVDNAVVNDTLYFYVVTATDTNGDVSVYSSEAAAAPFVPNGTAPAVPNGFGAAATAGSVSLDWNDNGEGDFNSYNVYRSTTSGSYGAALATGVIPSEYIDTDVVNGTTYFYVVTAEDHSSNESAQSSEISAAPASYGPTIVFGSNNDGDGGFASSAETGTEVWSLTADSVNYAFGLLATDESHTSSLLKSYEVDRTEGSSYAIEGVVDLTAGYGDDNNRIGMLLFNSAPTQTDDGGGLYLRLNVDGNGIAIANGLNGAILASGSATGGYSGDSWIGTTITLTADVLFTNVAGTDKIDLTFTFTDQNSNTGTLTAQVDAAAYTGNYFGFLNKWRQRGDDNSNRNVPPIFDYKSFSFLTTTLGDITPPSAPTSLAATAGNEFVSLDWDDNGEGDFASYSVYRSTTSGSYGGALETGLFSSSYVDDTAVNGNTYYYVVRAVDANDNESSSSGEVTATPFDPNNDPVFDEGLLVKTSVEANQPYDDTLVGDASDPDGDSVSYAKVSGPSWLNVASNGVLSGSPTPGDVGPNSWTVEVTDGNEGSAQATLQITVSADVTLPSAPTGASATASFSQVSLNWDDNVESDLAGYTVYRTTTSGNYGAELVSGLVSSDYIDTSAVNDTTYYYVVTAVDTADNESLQSSEVSGTPTDSTPPAAPTNLAASAGHNVVSLTWDDNAEGDLASYSVYRSLTSGSFGAALISGLISSTYVDTSVINGTTYYYLVVAIDSSGNESIESNEVSSTPQAVTGATAFVGDGVSGAADNYIGTTANWDNGLPVGQQGSIAIDAHYDSNTTHTAYEVLHTAGEVRRGNGFAGFNLGAGSAWIMDGATASFAATRGIALNDSQFTLNDGNADFTDNNKDTAISGASAIMIINGGTMSVARNFEVRDGGNFTINGGSLVVGGSILSPGHKGPAGSIQFKGGTVTAQQFAFDKPATLTFWGSSIGSLTLSTALGTGATLNWLTGTQITMTAATDEWAATEWDAGRLLYNGLSKTDLGKTWAQVTAVDGLEADVRFVYDSNTETLSLEVGGPPADADGDSMDDQWEIDNLDSTDGDGSADTDSDGVADFFEYLYGSDPSDGTSLGFKVQVSSNAGTMVFEWDVQEGFDLGIDYLIEYCTDLTSPAGWQPLPEQDYTLTPTTAGGMTGLELEITADHGANVFIRLVQP